MYGPPLGDGGLRNSGPNPSGLLPNGMANMGKLGPPTPANMNAYTAQQQHMLHQYHLSVMHPGMNPFFNNSMMLPSGEACRWLCMQGMAAQGRSHRANLPCKARHLQEVVEILQVYGAFGFDSGAGALKGKGRDGM